MISQEDRYIIAKSILKAGLIKDLYDVVFLDANDSFWLNKYGNDKHESDGIVFLTHHVDDKLWSDIEKRFIKCVGHAGIFLRYGFGGVFGPRQIPKTFPSYEELNIPREIRRIQINELLDYEK